MPSQGDLVNSEGGSATSSEKVQSFRLEVLVEVSVAGFIRIRTSRAPQDALVEKLHGATGGNPLFVDGVAKLSRDRIGDRERT